MAGVHPSSANHPYAQSPSLCGNFLTSKRSVVAFVWTITVVLTFIAFCTAGITMIHTHTTYARMDRSANYYNYNDRRRMESLIPWKSRGEEERRRREYDETDYDRYLQEDEQDGGQDERNSNSQDHRDEPEDEENSLTKLTSQSVTFTGVYTIFLSLGLVLYGSTAVVGFTSLRGDYIYPCLQTSNLRLGIFGGAIIVFANLLVVCAVICSEIKVRVLKVVHLGVPDQVLTCPLGCRLQGRRGEG